VSGRASREIRRAGQKDYDIRDLAVPAQENAVYAWFDAQRRLYEAWLAWATPGCRTPSEKTRAVLPLFPGADWLLRFMLPAAAPPSFDIESVKFTDVCVPVEESVADRQPFCTLRRFSRCFDRVCRQPAGAGPPPAPVLLCGPLAGHHAVMLRDTVTTLLKTRDVYLTDWTDARDVPLATGRFGLDDDVRLLARHLRLLSDSGVHVVAICQASAPALAATALHIEAGGRTPLSVTLIGGPIDSHPNPTAIDRFALRHSVEWLRRELIDTVPPPYAGAGRRVLPGYLQLLGLFAANPQHQLALEASRWRAAFRGDERGIADARHALDAYAAVIDMDEAYFLETVQGLFKDNALAAGTYRVDGQAVPLGALAHTPLFTIEGELDRITGATQTHAALDLCRHAAGTARRRETLAGCGHYDLFSGSHWEEEVYPALEAFWNVVPPRRETATP
jgi:poly(3-hydroxybutyrate) depolymerase